MKKILFFLILLLTMISSQVFAVTVNSPNAILIDADTGRILYEKDPYRPVYPASTTKILTAILTLENCDINDEVTASYAAIMSVPVGGSHAAIQVGETLRVKELLQALLICSGNDAANILAEHIGGSMESFATMMNTRAKELGCQNTNFVNASGLHDENHYTTAYDLAILYKYATDNFPEFNEIVATIRFRLPITDKYGTDDRFYLNSNQLIVPNSSNSAKNYYYPYATGGKTGFTTQSKNCLVAGASKDGVNLIAVILGAVQDSAGVSYRFTDAKNLFDYGFSAIVPNQIAEAGTTVKTLPVKNSKEKDATVKLQLKNGLTTTIDRTDLYTKFEPVLVFEEEIVAPVTEGDILGTATYTIYDKEYKIDLIAANSIEAKNNLVAGVTKFLKNTLITVGLLGLLLVVIRAYNKNEARKRRMRRSFNVGRYNSRFRR